jgi:hypothetical protein
MGLWLHPIIYVRGYAMTEGERNETAADPFCGFNVGSGEGVDWKSPLGAEGFCEYRDGAVLKCLGIDSLPKRPLSKFWPTRGPVWDALATTTAGRYLFVEAKAHIAEAASPGMAATSESSKTLI